MLVAFDVVVLVDMFVAIRLRTGSGRFRRRRSLDGSFFRSKVRRTSLFAIFIAFAYVRQVSAGRRIRGMDILFRHPYNRRIRARMARRIQGRWLIQVTMVGMMMMMRSIVRLPGTESTVFSTRSQVVQPHGSRLVLCDSSRGITVKNIVVVYPVWAASVFNIGCHVSVATTVVVHKTEVSVTVDSRTILSVPVDASLPHVIRRHRCHVHRYNVYVFVVSLP